VCNERVVVVVWLCGCVVSFGVYRVDLTRTREARWHILDGRGAQKKSARQASSPLDGLAAQGTAGLLKRVGNARENAVLERSQSLSPDAVLLSSVLSPDAVLLSSVLSQERSQLSSQSLSQAAVSLIQLISQAAVLLSSVLSQARSQLLDFRLHQGG